MSLKSCSAKSLPRLSRKFIIAGVVLTAVCGMVIVPSFSARAAVGPVNLGAAGSFAVLAGAGITNSGSTTITGDVGSSPTPTETGFGSVSLSGINHFGDSVTVQAKADFNSAYTALGSSSPVTQIPAELGAQTFLPGAYHAPTLTNSGTTVLDGAGDPNAVFIFLVDTTLDTAAGSSFTLINQASACNVYWRVGTSATLGANSLFVGNILASTATSFGSAATVHGRVMVNSASVTLIGDAIDNLGCPASTAAATTTTTAPMTTTTAGPTTTTIVPTTTTVPTSTTTFAPTTTTAPTTATSAPTTASTTAPVGATTSSTVSQSATAADVSAAELAKREAAQQLATAQAAAAAAERRQAEVAASGLAYTGFNPWLAVVGALAIALGTIFEMMSRRLSPKH